MKKILLILAVLFTIGLAGPVYAAGCDNLTVSGLPDSAVIALKQKCVDLNSITTVPASATDIAEYAELGKKYGIALSEVAKSIGTTVNELAQTPVGKFMLVMVAYKVMGEDLIGIVGGVLWFSTMIPLWIFMFYKLVFSTRTVTEKFAEGKLVSRVKEPVNYKGPAGPIAVVMMFMFIVVCVSGFFMVFA